MFYRKSASGQLSDLDNELHRDVCILEEAMRREYGPKRCYQKKKPVRNGTVIVETAGAVEYNSGQLADRAKELRNITKQRFTDLIAKYEHEYKELEQELEKYRNQKNTAQTRVEKRNEEIENLRAENNRITDLLVKSEAKILEMSQYKSQEKDERVRSELLSDQIYDVKKIKVDLKKRILDAERLLTQTKSEKRALIEENKVLKEATAKLRSSLKESTSDTDQARHELNIIEEIIKRPGEKRSEDEENTEQNEQNSSDSKKRERDGMTNMLAALLGNN